MKNKKTNFSSPKMNIFAGINDLRKALAYGENAVLVKEYNENCNHPIRVKKEQDFRQYKFSYAIPTTRKSIIEDKSLTDFQKYLSLNYVNLFAKSNEAIENYYGTGELSPENIGNVGRAHLVKVTDLINLLRKMGENERADIYYQQYVCSSGIDSKHWFDFFKTDCNNVFDVKKFKKKLWVVEIHKDKIKLNMPTYQKVLIKIFNAILHPLKYIPRKSILKMEDYTNYNFSVGGITNGFSIQFQIPKKFSFK